MKRITFVLMLLAVAFTGAQAISTGKAIIATEDTIVTKELDDIEIDIDIEKVVEKALDDIDADIPREEIIKELRMELGKNISEEDLDEKLAYMKMMGDGDFEDDKRCYREYHKHYGHYGDAGECKDRPWGVTFISMFMRFIWRLIVLIMWIITLIVVGRGLSKIARSKQQKENS